MVEEFLRTSGEYNEFLNLPTSQVCYRQRYFYYQSERCPGYTRFFMVQMIFYIFLMIYNSIFLFINNMIEYTNQTERKFPPPLSASNVSITRQNLAIFSAFVVPLCWALSYFFQWLYFRLDRGFFSGTNMRFRYEGCQSKDVITGTWEDLNDFNQD